MPAIRLPAIPAGDLAVEERSEQVAQIRHYYAELARLDTVAFRIRVANREFCKRVTPQIGLYAAAVPSLPSKYRSFANEALNVGWTKATAIVVVPGSPAANAGIVPGDKILTFGGVAVPAKRTPGWIGGYLAEHHADPVPVTLRRDGEERTVTVDPVMACSIPIDLVSADAVNAFTTGERIVISSAIVDLAKTDAQLAVIVGHELAYVNLGQTRQRRMDTWLGTAGGMVIDGGFMLGGMFTDGAFTRHFTKAGARAYSVEFEREADYVGAYYAARAGYDVSGAEQIWRAIGLAHPDSIHLGTRHPTAPARFIQMREVAAEIAEKKRLHLPLVPDMKSGPAPSLPAVSPQTIY
jgi:Peptidase family M48/PDZ domain